MNVQNTAIRKGRKFDQVLQGARVVFLAEGFDAANMDRVAKASGVSKATLYSYFPDKESLFAVVVQRECALQAEQALQQIDQTAPPTIVLTCAARHLLGFMTSDFGQRMFRMCVINAERFPELGLAFYNSGPMVVRARLSDYFEAAVERGDLDVSDTLLAADQFAELCKADIFPKLLFGVQTEFHAIELDRVIEGAVTTFLARYGV
ncbi:MAG: TetR/AcrR family transcriptional regulator [Planktotalea sp.]|uniref:TetR/AcrR family transcriptional regulator n=1 Tax=Planktotalea sp. TaxID=2029877 RepID=UPI003C76B0CE